MNFADRILQLKPSATLAVTAKAQELKAQGKDIISLSVGEPDFPTPAHIRDAAKEAIDLGLTKYTPAAGTLEVKKAVVSYFKNQYEVSLNPENTMVSNGGKQCLYNICQTILNPGDHVLIPAPYWVSYPAMVELAGAKPVIIPASAESGFKISIEQLEKSWTPKTKMLIINSPSNPTGACYSKKELYAIADWAISKNLIVVSDEIYDQLVYDNIKPISLSPLWEKHPENIIIVNGTAKTFAMTGWRVGYTLATKECIDMLTKLQGQSTSNICTISQYAATKALLSPLDAVKEMKVSFERRRNLAMDIISTWPKVNCPRPTGAFYAFPDMHAHYSQKVPNSNALCTMLLDKAGVAAVPGIAFGDDNCMRISFAVSDEDLKKALTRIGEVLFN